MSKRHRIPDPGVKKAPDPGVRNTACVHGEEAECGDAGFRIWIPDPDFLPIPDIGSGSAKLIVCREKKQKAVMREKEILCRILTFYPSRILDPGVKKAPDPGSRICNTACVCREKKPKR